MPLTIEQAINSGRYFTYNPQTGMHERSSFLNYLHKLLVETNAFISTAKFANITKFLTTYNRKGLSNADLVKVEGSDILAVTAMLDHFENMVQLTSALLAYILGNKASLDNIQLNKPSPIDAENDLMNAERPTAEEVMTWVQGNHGLPQTITRPIIAQMRNCHD